MLRAQALTRRGLKVFPLLENSKHPAIKAWPSRATSDPVEAGAFFRDHDRLNIGVSTAGMLVVDLDAKHNGEANWKGVVDERSMFDGELPPTYTVITPSGGKHLYFVLPPKVEVRNSAGKIAPGVDIRGKGGYVVAPGSAIDGRKYEAIDPAAKFAYAPDWLVDLAQKARPRTESAGQRLNDETPEAVAEAWKYIREGAPRPEAGERNSTAYEVAARLYDFGVSDATADECMMEWNESLDDPLEQDELETATRSGGRNRAKGIGVDNPGVEPPGMDEGEWGAGETPGVVPEKGPPEVKLRAMMPKPRGFLTFEQSCAYALRGRDPLVERVLYAGELSVTYGDSGARKTMMQMDMLYHIATGQSWHGYAVEQGATFWVAAEGGMGAHMRFRALNAHYRPKAPVPFGILEQPVNLLSSEKDALTIVQEVRRAEAAFGQPIKILDIDTWNAVAEGSDEGVAATSVLLARIRKIREALGSIHINIIHHPGKDLTKGMRGSSSLRAALETSIEVRKDSKTSGTAWVKKQRDGEDDFELLRFEGKVIDIGPDECGRPLSSQVIVPRIVEGMAEVERKLCEEQPWVEEGVARSTWFRRKAEEERKAAEIARKSVRLSKVS